LKVEERVVLPLGLADAWDFVWQVERLAACIPGCNSVQVIEPGKHYKARVGDRVGPYRVEVDMDVVVEDIRERESIRILATGEDRKLGASQRMSLEVRLREQGTSKTAMDIDADIEILGKIASLGQFIVKRKVRDVVKQFGDNVRAATAAQSRGAGHA
jgi:uncharacterized protein